MRGLDGTALGRLLPRPAFSYLIHRRVRGPFASFVHGRDSITALVPPEMAVGPIGPFSEGLESVCTGDCSSNPTLPFSRGYIDRDGMVVIPMQFGIASNFSEGLAQVCIGKCVWEKDSGYSGKFGFIDH